VIFFAVAMTVTGLAHFYLYRRLFRATSSDSRVRRIGLWAILSLWALLFVSAPLNALTDCAIFETFLVTLQWEFTAGHYRHGDSHLYVSRGTGFWGPPMRVGSPPEIVKVTLRAA
jgi:hypothetical protein